MGLGNEKGIDQVKTIMGNEAFAYGKFSRPYVHPTINLHGVSADHFAVYALSDYLCDIRFPRSGRAYYADYRL